MSPNPLSETHVLVCFAPGKDTGWIAVSHEVHKHAGVHGSPARRMKAAPRRWWQLPGRWAGHLLEVQLAPSGPAFAAGGRKAALDLDGTARTADLAARARYQAWHHDIAGTTPRAKTWEDYLAGNAAKRAGTQVGREELRRQFLAQPRVLAMTAASASGVHKFDPYELDLYQCNEATYACFYWQTALVGDALITADGQYLKPASTSTSDRFEYFGKALAYLRGLADDSCLCVVAVS
ncbi:hypothetical protein Rhe02_09720 [Rhizocola hellebori]|uniref:Uncharacterized protein n=1 Tax=Rhizocola hellebori TaxID=1392758 RepID=A0A8J3VDP4_9ACTN|nr:hypothetical protein [Rhizocola hellebori]GIH02905.1 hypothetical protein Rhe02_09720 [Rhizocola hellebori]